MKSTLLHLYKLDDYKVDHYFRFQMNKVNFAIVHYNVDISHLWWMINPRFSIPLGFLRAIHVSVKGNEVSVYDELRWPRSLWFVLWLNIKCFMPCNQLQLTPMLIVNRSYANSFGCVKICSTGSAAAVELAEWEGVNRQQTLDYTNAPSVFTMGTL